MRAAATQQFSMERPDEQKPQTLTFSNGTMFGGASGQQASSLAQLIIDSKNNIKDYEQLEGTYLPRQMLCGECTISL